MIVLLFGLLEMARLEFALELVIGLADKSTLMGVFHSCACTLLAGLQHVILPLASCFVMSQYKSN